MLEGKPARVDEKETMDAIRRILTDFEDAFPDPAPVETAPEPEPLAVTTAVQQADLSLTPVAEVEAKVASAKFTTVPNVERLSAVARTIESSMKTPQSATSKPKPKPAPRNAAAPKPAANGKRGRKWPALPRLSLSLPQVSVPKFTRPQPSKTGSAELTGETVKKSWLSLRMPRLALPTLPKFPLRTWQAPRIEPPELPSKAPGQAARQTNKMPQLREATERTAPKLSRQGLLSLRYHITPVRVALVALAVALLIWPALTILLLIGALFLFALPFVILGIDGVWDKVGQTAMWYCARHPERKDAIYDALDGLALRWDTFLERFPEDWVEGFFMPDFANMEEVQHQHEQVVSDRLSRMQNQI